MILTFILLIAFAFVVAKIWTHFFAKSEYIKALLNLQGILALFLVIWALGGYGLERLRPTFDISVEKAEWYQDVPRKFADNGEGDIIINKNSIDERGIDSYIYLQLQIENTKDYVSSITDIEIDTLYLEHYEDLRIRYEPLTYQSVDSIHHYETSIIPEGKEQFFWDRKWWDSVDLSVFQPKQKRPIYAIFQFKTDSILIGEFEGEFDLIDMGMKKIREKFKAVQGRDGRAKEFVKR